MCWDLELIYRQWPSFCSISGCMCVCMCIYVKLFKCVSLSKFLMCFHRTFGWCLIKYREITRDSEVRDRVPVQVMYSSALVDRSNLGAFTWAIGKGSFLFIGIHRDDRLPPLSPHSKTHLAINTTHGKSELCELINSVFGLNPLDLGIWYFQIRVHNEKGQMVKCI